MPRFPREQQAACDRRPSHRADALRLGTGGVRGDLEGRHGGADMESSLRKWPLPAGPCGWARPASPATASSYAWKRRGLHPGRARGGRVRARAERSGPRDAACL